MEGILEAAYVLNESQHTHKFFVKTSKAKKYGVKLRCFQVTIVAVKKATMNSVCVVLEAHVPVNYAKY
jgi:hypothetical protein